MKTLWHRLRRHNVALRYFPWGYTGADRYYCWTDGVWL